MFSICTSPMHSFLLGRWKGRQLRASFISATRRIGVAPWRIPCSVNDNSTLHDFDPSKELLELEVDSRLRNVRLFSEKERSWFGPNGQYIRELPCPGCRGRGYTPCPECGVDRSRPDCFQCTGKGVKTCRQCLGECVIWEESYDERPWEKARSSSLFKVKEDDEVDRLDIKVDAGRKSRRIYRTPTPEVSLKISRSLRSLNAKTGLFSKRMKIIHQDPVLYAQRVAAIKKTKGTPAARKRASEISKAYFSDPENRLKRSMAMRGYYVEATLFINTNNMYACSISTYIFVDPVGVKFFCSHCGEEGHRRHYCHVLRGTSTETRFRCSLCGARGHNLRTCGRSTMKKAQSRQSKLQHCKLCGRSGHHQPTCPQLIKVEEGNSDSQGALPGKAKRSYSCKLCLGKGHNSRTCPTRKVTGETSTKVVMPEQVTIK